MTKVTIITVCRNSESTIVDTLESVLGQTYSNIEYIVIDGASSDETMTKIKPYASRIHCLVSEPDNGLYDALNKGIQLATGDIIGFLHADDIYMHSEVIQEMLNAFASNDIQACFSDLVYCAKDDVNLIRRYWRSSPFKPGLFAKGWSPPHPTFFVKRHIYQLYGCFKTNGSLGNDIELMMRFLEKHQIKTKYIPKTWIKMRLGGMSNRSIKNILRQNKQILLEAKQLGISIHPVTFIFYKIIDRVKQLLAPFTLKFNQ